MTAAPEAQNTYQQMFDHEISKELSGSGGLGLAQVIRDQLALNNTARKGISYYEIDRAESGTIDLVRSTAPTSFSLGIKMADLLTIGGNALRTNQSALAVVSNNIANVNTEGYVRQELDVSENLPSKSVPFIGSAVATGVMSYDSLVAVTEGKFERPFCSTPSHPIYEQTYRCFWQ